MERVMAMRFVLWAANVPPHLLTPRQVSGLLDISYGAARRWLRDYHRATAQTDINGLPGFLIPNPQAPFRVLPVATSTAHLTPRS